MALIATNTISNKEDTCKCYIIDAYDSKKLPAIKDSARLWYNSKSLNFMSVNRGSNPNCILAI